MKKENKKKKIVTPVELDVKDISIDFDIELDKNDDVKIQDINFIGRGFSTLEEANEFINTDTFKKLGIADQAEYKNWLKK